MSVEQAAPEPLEIGWIVTDPDGNVVDSGPVSEAKAVAWVGELLQQQLGTEGEQ
jgi:hypothetical protein